MSARPRSRPRKRVRGVESTTPVPAAAPAAARRVRVSKKEEKGENVELSPAGSTVSAPVAVPTSEAAKPAEPQPCGICLDNVKEQGVLNVCPHVFCFDCIMTWSKTANTCPICKREFTQIRPLGVDGKKPKRRRATYNIKTKQQVWEPSREDLLSAAGFLEGEYASEDDESYDPETDEFYETGFLDGLWPDEPIFISDDDEEDEEEEEAVAAFDAVFADMLRGTIAQSLLNQQQGPTPRFLPSDVYNAIRYRGRFDGYDRYRR